jgi:hypothetical protein
MHKFTFYPIGNADCCLIDLENEEKILFDYAHFTKSEDEEDKRIDLEVEIIKNLRDAKRDYFDVVAFTHVDNDHISGFSELFYLDHAEKYQSKDRIKINELWVPAAVIIEEGLDGEAGILRAEARYRLKKGNNIRVFARPERLKEWLEKEGLKLEDRKHLITGAGNLVPGYDKSINGVEIFVHSPFSISHDNETIDRNECSIVVQMKFGNEKESTVIMGADTTYEIWKDIIDITKYNKNNDRLKWDIFKISHHCSYKALSEEKGKEKTDPIAEIKWMFEEQGNERSIMVATCKPITEKSGNDDQPPHRQAANYYKEVKNKLSADFVVTMEHPDKNDPKPVIITIDSNGVTLKKDSSGGVEIIVGKPAPRAGL